MSQSIFLLISILLSQTAIASTFVGNGGNSGDVELLVTQRIIRQTLDQISESDKTEGLCTCSSTFKGSSICQSLEELTQEQAGYCAKTLKENASALSEILSSSTLRTVWTHSPIFVNESGRNIGVEAVANHQENSITINQDSFVSKSPSHRVFLLSHELFHLISVEGKQSFSDEGQAGPFDSASGGRKLINAMAAATAVEAHRFQLYNRYQRSLSRPQGWKTHWIGLFMGSASVSLDEENSFAQDEYSYVELSYEYFHNNWGLYLGTSGVEANKEIFSSTTIDESIATYKVGLSYRYFPFEDPLSFFGQSHLRASIGLTHNIASLEVTDSLVGFEDEVTFQGAYVSCNYYIPMVKNFWGVAGGEVSTLNYEYNQLELSYTKPRSSLKLGVSYAF